ncbi:MAG: hypothetical protein HWD58_18865 [Bacteroidota bacterium]|nr:MAG: hypothetical protein HWD58_18865 [Bacteroidota bacterium]
MSDRKRAFDGLAEAFEVHSLSSCTPHLTIFVAAKRISVRAIDDPSSKNLKSLATGKTIAYNVPGIAEGGVG